MQTTILCDNKLCEIVKLPPSPCGAGPKYEVMAPDGYLFDGELSSLVCFDMADVRERAASHELWLDSE